MLLKGCKVIEDCKSTPASAFSFVISILTERRKSCSIPHFLVWNSNSRLKFTNLTHKFWKDFFKKYWARLTDLITVIYSMKYFLFERKLFFSIIHYRVICCCSYHLPQKLQRIKDQKLFRCFCNSSFKTAETVFIWALNVCFYSGRILYNGF